MSTVTPRLTNVYGALRGFLQSVVPGVEVVQGLGNRVPMPPAPFIAMTAILSKRLATNLDSYVDPYLTSGFTFTGTASAVGNVMTVSIALTGTLNVGDLVGGENVPYQTFVTGQTGGTTGGVGTYTLSTAGGFISAAITVTDGVRQSEQDTQIDIQIDAYGPNAADWAAMISTLFRDEYGVQMLAPYCAPLYIDSGMQAPLIDAESQYEQRIVMTGTMQYNPVTVTGQQFAGALGVTAVNVPTTYPAV